ncbi:sugar transferase [Nocardioides sp. R-C-SC26]|uniref:sugar transferase n=1 Tax=Nocardioides sp. R-C-SC26 TaxID=2870414 RepID=UPI001E48E00B|nr:sugar transferase [Nocardioides sp. R-C-SC26]
MAATAAMATEVIVAPERARGRAAQRLIVRGLALLDLGIVALVCAVALMARDLLAPIWGSETASMSLWAAAIVFGLGWVVALRTCGAYEPHVLTVGSDEFKRVARATAANVAAVSIACYFAGFTLSRSFVAITVVVGLPCLLVGRLSMRRALHRAHRRNRLTSRVLLSGVAQHIDEIAEILERQAWLGYEICGALTPGGIGATTPRGIPVVGAVESPRAAIDLVGADVLFLADTSISSSQQLREMVWELEEHDVSLVVAPRVADISHERVRVRPVGGLPLIHLEKTRGLAATRRLKRIFDVVVTLGLIVAIAPLMLLIAARVRFHDGGPVLYRQDRVGRDGSVFGCLKFRTMVTNADDLRAELAEANGISLFYFKLADDPRITRPGRWLRRLSLDELPQLFNVLRGEMSLVGPRPLSVAEVAAYSGSMQRRHLIKPGLTGLWQVSGRSELSAEEAMRLDLFYVDNWSIVQDLIILWRTFGAVLGSRGAY